MKMKRAKKTMTLNLTEREMNALNKMAEDKGMSKTQIVRMALRVYQSIEYPIDISNMPPRKAPDDKP